MNYVLGHLLSKIKAVLPRVENTFGRAGCEPPRYVSGMVLCRGDSAESQSFHSLTDR